MFKYPLRLLTLLLLAGNASAAMAADAFSVEPGNFISIPVAVPAGNEVTVLAPAYLQLMSAPQIRSGRALVNLLANRDAPAGETVLTVQLRQNGQLLSEFPVRVIVSSRVSFELIAPEGLVAVDGETVTYGIIVINTGNVADRYRLSANSSLQYRFSPTTLELAPGEQGEVRLMLEAAGRARDTMIIRVESDLDPQVRQQRVITTTIQPFTGAAGIDGPALAYEFTAAAAWGSTGFSHAMGARLSGDLSEYVQLGSNLEFRNNHLTGGLALSGNDWSVNYRGFAQLQGLEARYGRVRGFLSVPLGRSGFSTGLTYAADSLAVSLTHTTAKIQSDAFRVSYSFDPTAAIRLTPSVGLQGYGEYDADYRIGALLGLDIGLQTDALNAKAAFTVTLPQEPSAPWSLTASASNRVQSKFSLNGELSVNPRHLHAGVSAREVLTSEVTLSQGVRYAVTFGNPALISANIGVSYRPEGASLRLHGALAARWRDGEAHLGFLAGVDYQPGSWELELAVEELDGFHVTAGAAYRFESFAVRSVFGHGPRSRPLLLGASGGIAGLQLSLLAGYDFLHKSFAAELDTQYQFTNDFSAFTSLAYEDDDFRFQVGASLRFRGGFATPDRVVDLFGGRAVGWIEGRVFQDLNGNGLPDASEGVPSGAVVSAGGVSIEVDSTGSYRLALPAGEYEVTVSNLTATLALNGRKYVTVSQNESQVVMLPLQTVTGLTGTVFDDKNRDGDGAGEKPFPYARVIIENAHGEKLAATSDDQGMFYFQGLTPGRYTISLDAGSLPAFHEVTTPPQELELQPGPFPRLTLGATAQEKTVTRTFTHGDLALTVRTEPTNAPAGADIQVIASTQGDPGQVTAYLAGSTTLLEEQGEGVYSAIVTLPDTAGVEILEVVASDSTREARRSLTLILQPGALAHLHVQPPFLEPGESAQLSAAFLTRVDTAFVLYEGKRYELTPTDRYTFNGPFTAPAEPGSYEVELWADDQLFTTARFRVAD